MPASRLLLVMRKLSPQSFAEKELSFKVPELGEGEYILFLRSGEENSPAISTGNNG